MAKIANDAATYRKRSDLAKPAASETKRLPRPLTEKQKATIVSKFGTFGFGQAAFVPFGRLVKK